MLRFQVVLDVCRTILYQVSQDQHCGTFHTATFVFSNGAWRMWHLTNRLLLCTLITNGLSRNVIRKKKYATSHRRVT